MDKTKKISIIIPTFNEQDNVDELHRRIVQSMNQSGYEYEIVFVDDGSTDRTYEHLEKLHAADGRVKVISLSRNFGHQAAILAGLDAAAGQAVIMMDGDLQHPPEQLPLMLNKWEEGYEIVSMVREKTPDAGFFKNFTASVFYFLINLIGNVHIERHAADFRLVNGSVAQTLRNMRERSRFQRGLIGWVGFKKISLPYSAGERFAGQRKYTFRKMLLFALDAVVSFSAFPLRMSAFLGFIAIILALIYFIYIIYVKVAGFTVPGWTSTLAVIIFFGGVQLLILGVIGEYISRIYEETKQRPVYIVRRSLGFHEEKNKI
ncbi:MAG: glycosyltransferase family 2 protein [bacterium]